MVNKVFLLGNLGRDPETRNTTTGQRVTNFSLATSRKWNDQNGNKQEQTEWHNVVAWGKLAQIASDYLRKGDRAFVEGRLQTRSWEDKDTGEKKYKTEVVCLSLQLLGGHDGNRGSGSGGGGPADEIPF